MPYFSSDMPAPQPNQDDEAFWQGCREQRLRFQVCKACGQAVHPPVPVCPSCQAMEIGWQESAGRARVYTYTVVHHPSHDAVRDRLPYVVAAVEFSDVPGVRLVTNITDVDPVQVRIGMPVSLWWDDIGEGMHIPRFRPDSGEAEVR